MGQRGGAAIETTSVPLKKPLRTALCQRRRALHHCGDLDRSQTTGLSFVGSLNRLNQIGIGRYDFMVLFSIPHKTPGLRPTDRSCHHETWLHLEFVDWRSTQSHHEEHDRRILLKERPTACPYGQQKRRTSEVMSDQSPSSRLCDNSHAFINIMRNVYIFAFNSIAGMLQFLPIFFVIHSCPL